MVREEKEKAFQDLEAMFGVSTNFEEQISPKPFLIRTDESNYALGQSSYKGEDKEEHQLNLLAGCLAC
ncbi:hypothetical protein TNCV_278941 [Trichonephila clavipes]|nr:hypothetical protein TNCV_278941 [Trichonephila clavipes]